MGRRTRLLKAAETRAPATEVWVEAPWWLPTVMPDLTWARDLMLEKDRERLRSRVVLATMLMLGSGGIPR